MPGLKQAGCVAKYQRKAHLAHFGFAPVPRTPALQTHTTKPIISPSSLTTLESSTSAKRMPTTSLKPSKKSTPYPSTGMVPYSADSPLNGTMPHAPVTSPFQNIYKQPFINSNICCPNARNTPHTPGKTQPTERMCNMHRMTTLLLSCLPKQST